MKETLKYHLETGCTWTKRAPCMDDFNMIDLDLLIELEENYNDIVFEEELD